MKFRTWEFPAAFGVAALAYLTRYPLVDDAFITFRYSEQLRQFGELTYNGGEHVLGTTAWLWAIVVALARVCGISYECSSVTLSLISTIGVPYLILGFLTPTFISSISLRPLVFVAAILFFPLLHMTATSGMESSFYIFVTLAAFAADSRRQPLVVAILSALAIGLRPDGVLVPLSVAAVRVWREPRYTCVTALASLALVMPWLLWSSWYYGSPIPHSVAAKQMIHPSAPLESVFSLVHRMNRSDLEVFLNVTGVVGMGRLLRYSICRAPILWLALYVFGLVFSGVDPLFFWYAAPWWIWIICFGTIGCVDLVLSVTHSVCIDGARARLAGVIPICICGLCCIQGVTLRAHALERFENMRMYSEVLPTIQAQFTAHDSMYLCEIGYIGYSLPSAYVIDSAGIVSPQVLDLVPIADRHERAKVVLRHERAVEKFHPKWYVSLHDICSARELEAQEWFRRDYSLVASGTSATTSGVVVYRRN